MREALGIATTDQYATEMEIALRKFPRLSPCQAKVLAVMTGTGHTHKQLAHTLEISPRTIEIHVQEILKKLGVQSKLQAVLVAAAAGVPSFGENYMAAKA